MPLNKEAEIRIFFLGEKKQIYYHHLHGFALVVLGYSCQRETTNKWIEEDVRSQELIVQ